MLSRWTGAKSNCCNKALISAAIAAAAIGLRSVWRRIRDRVSRSKPASRLSASRSKAAASVGSSDAPAGVTVAALGVVEGLLLRGIPVLMVDRSGDLCRYADPDAWEEPEPDPARAARRAQASATEFGVVRLAPQRCVSNFVTLAV